MQQPRTNEKQVKPAKRNWFEGRLLRITVAVALMVAVVMCGMVVKKWQQSKAQDRFRAGNIYWRSYQNRKAISAYKEALRFDPENSDIWSALGLALQRSQDFPGAINAYEKAAALAPHEAQIHESLGMVFERAGMRGDAQAAYAKALCLYNADLAANPTYEFLYQAIGDLERRLNNPAKAATAYQSACAYYLKTDDRQI